jgi:acetoacetyl-CoA synthetase
VSVAEGDLLWEPSEEVRRTARVARFMRERGFGSHDELWRWSVTDLDGFWDAIWAYFGVLGERGDGPVLERAEMPDARWFPGATLNHARNMLRRAEEDPDATAVVFRTEADDADGPRRSRTLTYRELAAEVAEVRAGLRALGVGRGDRVAAYVPNIPEALVAFLATASLGAIWSSCSPDFGAPSVIDRFTQIEPKVLIAVDGYAYNGKRFDRSAVVRDIQASLPTLTATVTIPYLDPDAEPIATGDGRAIRYAELRHAGESLAFEEVPFEHPLWILYSSGTTGLPKPIVHGHGGIVLEHLKALTFHQDLGPGDVFFWYTTTGWMMWNYLIGGLLVGATVVLYDGAPGGDTLWRLAADTGVTYFGVGAPYVLASMKAGSDPAREYDLSRIRGIGSTGSPLPPEGFRWLYDHVGRDLLVGSFSGGTDVATGFVGPCPLLPLRAGVIQCRGLGAMVEAYDEKGEPVIGEVGELVLTEPMPSMPIYFWNDPEGTRYRDAYFSRFDGVWRHGDWIEFTERGSVIVSGRSDATLNKAGVRMGSADIYAIVDPLPGVADSLVIGVELPDGGYYMPLFVVPEAGADLDELRAAITAAIRRDISPRHVPDEIVPAPGVPRTLTGKRVEVPIKEILRGTAWGDLVSSGAVANPEVLDWYADFGRSRVVPLMGAATV